MVTAIRPGRGGAPTGIVYEILLDTAAERYSADAPVFDSLLRSFRLLPE